MEAKSFKEEAVNTRIQHKKVKQQLEEDKQKEEVKQKLKVRLIPIWLRIVLIIVLMGFSLVIGAIIGYSVMGSGSVVEVFQKSTWTHIIDLVNKE